MTKNMLIIKISALGDVLRTTPILHKFKDYEITWLTSEKGKPLLETNPYINQLLTLESLKQKQSPPDVWNKKYDILLNMDEDEKCCELSTNFINSGKATNFYGYFLNKNNKIDYKGKELEWFDMGITSKLGKDIANRLKWQNTKVYQEHLFSILGLEFKGEEYILNYAATAENGLVGIQNPSERESKWPMKRWNRYNELADEIKKFGYKTKFLESRPTLKEHIVDIANCQYVICEDSLPMHIALALKKPTIALFICTPPNEIYSYGRLAKIVSPKLKEYFYRRDFDPNAAKTIKLETVLSEFKNVINNNTII